MAGLEAEMYSYLLGVSSIFLSLKKDSNEVFLIKRQLTPLSSSVCG